MNFCASLHPCGPLRQPATNLSLVQMENMRVQWSAFVCLHRSHCTLMPAHRCLVAAQGLQQLEPAIMDKLLWPSVPMLTSVHLQEEVARRGRDTLSGCILASLTPLRRYAQRWLLAAGDLQSWAAFPSFPEFSECRDK
jgi:hypothetical protein